jgi:hypothetical protein
MKSRHIKIRNLSDFAIGDTVKPIKGKGSYFMNSGNLKITAIKNGVELVFEISNGTCSHPKEDFKKV